MTITREAVKAAELEFVQTFWPDERAISAILTDALTSDGVYSEVPAERAIAAVKLLVALASDRAAVRAEEREACAKVAEDGPEVGLAVDVAAAIRARKP